MVVFRACPRCHGDMQDGRDQYGEYKECLQCGYAVNIDAARPDFVIEKGRQRAGRPRKSSGRRSAA